MPSVGCKSRFQVKDAVAVENYDSFRNLVSIPPLSTLKEAQEKMKEKPFVNFRTSYGIFTAEGINKLENMHEVIELQTATKKVLKFLAAHAEKEDVQPVRQAILKATPNTPICPAGGLSVKSLFRLSNECWIDDEVISKVFCCWQQKYPEMNSDIMFMNPLWYEALCSARAKNDEKHWAYKYPFASGKEKTSSVDVHRIKAVYIVSHTNKAHFCMAKVCLESKAVMYGDSLGGEPPKDLFANVMYWLQYNGYDTSDFHQGIKLFPNYPIQPAGSGSCGVISLTMIGADVGLCEPWKAEFSGQHRVKLMRLLVENVGAGHPGVSNPYDGMFGLLDDDESTESSAIVELPTSTSYDDTNGHTENEANAAQTLVDLLSIQNASHGEMKPERKSFQSDATLSPPPSPGSVIAETADNKTAKGWNEDEHGNPDDLDLSQETIIDIQENTIFLSEQHMMASFLRYAELKGFQLVKGSSKKSENKLVLQCQCSRKPASAKMVDSAKPTTDKKSMRTNCSFRANVSSPKKMKEQWYCSKLMALHNHPLNPLDPNAARPLTNQDDAVKKSVMKEIEYLVNIGRLGRPRVQDCISHRFKDVGVTDQQLDNIIQKIKRRATTERDAADLIAGLSKVKEDENAFVEFDLDEDRRLVRIFWMRSHQICLWQRFFDVAISDNSAKKNCYNMPFFGLICIDNYGHSRLVAQALLSDERVESYKWVWEQLKKATGVLPLVLFTDADLALMAALQHFPEIVSFNCCFHISLNLAKNVKNQVDDWDLFVKTFHQCAKVPDREMFEIMWTKLVARFPKASDYMNGELYVKREKWALAWTGYHFTCSTETTQRAEGIFGILSKSLHAKTTLAELESSLNKRFLAEQTRNTNAIMKESIPAYKLPDVAGSLFKKVIDCVRVYATSYVTTCIGDQCKLSLLYDCSQLSQDELANLEITCDIDEENVTVGALWNDRQMMTCASIVEKAGAKNVVGCYKVNHIGGSASHYVILVRGGGHLCTCLLLLRQGWPCRHFFRLMRETPRAAFHISMVKSRWFKDEQQATNLSELHRQEGMIMLSGEQAEGKVDAVALNRSLKRLMPVTDEKMKKPRQMALRITQYGQSTGLHKKALQMCLDSNNTARLEELNAYLQNFIDSSEMQVANPKQVKGKGRPSGRIKSAVEKANVGLKKLGKRGRPKKADPTT